MKEVIKLKSLLATMEPQRRLQLALGALVVIVLLWGGYTVSQKYSTMKRTVSVRKGELTTFQKLAEEYLEKESRLSVLEKRLTPAATSRSVVSVIEELAEEIEVKDRLTSLLPLKEEERRGYLERGAEAKIEGIDLNLLINLLYRLEHHQTLLLIKELSLESRFDNRELLDVRLKIVQITRAPGNRG